MNNNYNFNLNNVVNNENQAEATPAPENNEVDQDDSVVSKIKGILNNFGGKGIAIFGALALVLVAVIVAVLIINSPANVAGRAISKVVDDFVDRGEISYLSSLFSGGSVDLSVSGNVDGAEMEIGGKVYLNLDDDAFMLDGIKYNMAVAGEEREITGSIYASLDKVYVSNKEILDGTYGITAGTLEESFKNSVFNPDSDSEYALDEDTYEAILSFCKMADSDLTSDLEKDLESVLNRYAKKLKKLIAKYAEFEKSTEEIKFHDGEKKVRVIYIIITPKTISNIVEDFYDYLKTDKKLRNLVIEYYGSFESTLKLEGYMKDDMDIAEMYDEAIESLGEDVERMVEDMDDADEGFVAIGIATPKTSAKMLKLWAISGEDVSDMDDKDEVIELFEVDFGKSGVKKTSAIIIEVQGEKIKYTVDKEEKGVTEYKLQLGDDYKVTLKFDKNEDKFKLSYTEKGYWGYESNYTLEGEYTTKSDKATLKLKKVKEDGEVMDDLDVDVTVVVDKKDKMPTPEKKVTSVFELTEEKIEEISERAYDWAYGR